MSKISMTVQQIWDLDLWDKVCEYKGWNPWIRNEGQILETEIVEFDDEFNNEEETCNFSENGKCIHCNSEGELNCNGSDLEKSKCMEHNEVG